MSSIYSNQIYRNQGHREDEEAAFRLYEIGKDAVASLEAFNKIWRSTGSSTLDNDSSACRDGTDNEDSNAECASSQVGRKRRLNFSRTNFVREHNEAILRFLAGNLRRGRDDCTTEGTKDSKQSIASEDSNKPISSDKEENSLINLFQSMLAEYSDARLSRQTGTDKTIVCQNEEHLHDLATMSTNESIVRYNLALALLGQGDPREAHAIAFPAFVSVPSFTNTDDDDRERSAKNAYHDNVQCEIAFLLLDIILQQHISLPSHSSSSKDESKQVSDLISKDGKKSYFHDDVQQEIDKIMSWIQNFCAFREKLILRGQNRRGGGEASVDSKGCSASVTAASQANEGHLHELKFRIHMYKSRILALRGNHVETQRLSKKEMKSAMEIFQHKIRNAAISAPSAATAAINAKDDDSNVRREAAMTDVLHNRYHICALYLKADLEHHRNNFKKSLKLCAEARRNVDIEGKSSSADVLGGGSDGGHSSMIDDAFYYNNVAILHQTSGKIYLALHYYSKAISLIKGINVNKGLRNCIALQSYSLKPQICDILHNTAICALQGKKYAMSYECMAKCVQSSPKKFACRPQCWLYMGEASIGYYEEQRKRLSEESDLVFHEDKTKRFIPRVVVTQQWDHQCRTRPLLSTGIPAVNGSSDDLKFMTQHPLFRALVCLQSSLLLCSCQSSIGMSKTNDYNCWDSSLLALSYVHLALDDPLASQRSSNEFLKADRLQYLDEDGTAVSRLKHLRWANIRALSVLYACEALCLQGKPQKALIFLVQGENESDTKDSSVDSGTNRHGTRLGSFHKLANALCWREIDQEQRTSVFDENSACEMRKALAVAHVVACGVSEMSGDLVTAEGHAIAASGDFSAGMSLNSSIARRALFHCFLRSDEAEKALSVLRAGR